MPRAPRHAVFVVCAPGLEGVLRDELDALGVRSTVRTGGASATVTTRQLYAAHLWLRTAGRVLVRVGPKGAVATDFGALQEVIGSIDWGPWLAPGVAVDVRASSTGSKLFHTGAIAERVADAMGRERAEDGSRIVVRLHHDEVTVNVDASGDALHRRGWRQATAKAPLRETMAAAMVLASGWRGDHPLVDPMCGSGTIAIEAALIARDLAPGRGRSFTFQHWPCFEPGTWASVVGEAARRARPSTAPIVARDRDAGATLATAGNAERAGVIDDLSIVTGALSGATDTLAALGPRGWLLTNPPYGRRVQGGADRRDLFARLGQVVTAAGPGWGLGVLVDEPSVAGHTGLRLDERWRSRNGGIPVRLLVHEPDDTAPRNRLAR